MGDLLTSSSTIMCPHGGTVTAVPSNTSVRLGGDAVVVSTDTFMVAGCPFNVGSTPQPCTLVQWELPAFSSSCDDVATLTTESVGMCQGASGAVQGVAIVQATQTQVSGT